MCTYHTKLLTVLSIPGPSALLAFQNHSSLLPALTSQQSVGLRGNELAMVTHSRSQQTSASVSPSPTKSGGMMNNAAEFMVATIDEVVNWARKVRGDRTVHTFTNMHTHTQTHVYVMLCAFSYTQNKSYTLTHTRRVPCGQ